MQIAVAGVEHIGDAQAVLRLHLFHAPQDVADLFAGYRAVHAVIVGRQASDRREGGLAPGPEQQPLLFGLAGAAGGRAMARGDRLNCCDEMIHLGLAAVELDDQQALRRRADSRREQKPPPLRSRGGP